MQKQSIKQKVLELFVKGFSLNFSLSGIIKQVGIIKSMIFEWFKVLKSKDKLEISERLDIFFKV
jgi:hypothetical protein